MVYCQRVEQTKQFGQTLGCRAYYCKFGNEQRKQGILQQLMQQCSQVFTTTNALELGIDAPSIRVMTHVGLRQKICDYAIESGWAGMQAFIAGRECQGL